VRGWRYRETIPYVRRIAEYLGQMDERGRFEQR